MLIFGRENPPPPGEIKRYWGYLGQILLKPVSMLVKKSLKWVEKLMYTAKSPRKGVLDQNFSTLAPFLWEEGDFWNFPIGNFSNGRPFLFLSLLHKAMVEETNLHWLHIQKHFFRSLEKNIASITCILLFQWCFLCNYIFYFESAMFYKGGTSRPIIAYHHYDVQGVYHRAPFGRPSRTSRPSLGGGDFTVDHGSCP